VRLPALAPINFVVPTSTMIITSSEHVDNEGRVNMPYLQLWDSLPDEPNLVEMALLMLEIFGQRPPLFSKPQEKPSPPPVPHQSRCSGLWFLFLFYSVLLFSSLLCQGPVFLSCLLAGRALLLTWRYSHHNEEGLEWLVEGRVQWREGPHPHQLCRGNPARFHTSSHTRFRSQTHSQTNIR